MQLFITGTVGLIGSDDVLACFIAGNVFTWDDWFRLETEDDSLQPTIDMLLNVSVFMWFGAVCPWHQFLANDVIPIYRLVPLGVMVLLFRRLPMVLTYHKLGLIHQIEHIRHALFVGFFGPIGVSAIFYLYISREFLTRSHEEEREDLQIVAEAIEIVVWFLVICSIVVHGLSVPLGKLGFYIPRTISTAISTERPSEPQSRNQSPERAGESSRQSRQAVNTSTLPFMRRRPTTSERGPSVPNPVEFHWIPRSFVRAGKHIIEDIKRPHGHTVHGAEDGIRKSDNSDSSDSKNGGHGGTHPEISMPTDARRIGSVVGGDIPLRDVEAGRANESQSQMQSPIESEMESGANTPTRGRPARRIQFADQSEEPTPLARSPNDGSPVEEKYDAVDHARS